MSAPDRQHSLDCIRQGILLFWRTLAKARGMQIHTGDIEYVMSNPRRGLECIYNFCFSPAALDRQIDEMIAGIHTRRMPDILLIPPGTKPGNLAQILVLKGFSIDTSGLCMALELPGPDQASLPVPRYWKEDIHVTQVQDPGSLRHWVEILNVAFTGSEIMNFDQCHDIFSLEAVRLFLGWLGEVPAAVCMTLTAGETAILEMVATLPEHRRKGLGTAVTSAALRSLQSGGIKTVTLCADPDGINLYKRVGFVEICDRVVANYRKNSQKGNGG